MIRTVLYGIITDGIFFVNDGDAVFTSRVFPDDSEHCFSIEGDTFNRMWTLKRAVKEEFLI